jgi:hypothetical protein
MGVTHLSGLEVAGVPTMGISGAPLFTGNWIFVDPAHGSDGNTGAADSPFQTIYMAYAQARDGYNDVIVLVGDGTTAGTARMSAALAASVDPTATTGTITWAKNALHLIGQASATMDSRARFAPPTGTYTAATFGNSGNMFNVTGQGCYFANFSVYNGFSTGATGQIAWIDAGGRNSYYNVSILGMNDAASAASTTSRSLKISGSVGENTFVACQIGGDTTARTAANASIEFAGGSPRNKFINCDFPVYATGGGSGALVATVGASGIDRWTKFDNCWIMNGTKSGGSALTVALSMNASPGGMILMSNCTWIGVTKIGDAGALANMYVNGGAPTAATTGYAVTPT